VNGVTTNENLIVVAVYHNEGAISKTHEKIQSVFARDLTESGYEIIFVDDGSKDGSLREILSLREQNPKVKVITLAGNFGQMAAMLAGFKVAIVLAMRSSISWPICRIRSR
jgi:glycosyltransferase involved in cell wall biosynthesis